MRQQTLLLALAIAHAVYGATSNALCNIGDTYVAGNWYCQEVKKISYTGINQSGSYKATTAMDENTGVCSRKDVSYSGPGAPLDGEVSIHLRGPLKLSQFAAYTMGGGSSASRKQRRHGHGHGHDHGQLHSRHAAKRAAGDLVTAVINGQTVTWAKGYDSTATPVAGQPAANVNTVEAGTQTSPAASGSTPATPSTSIGDGKWGRVAYYSVNSKDSAAGLAFLNNQGSSYASGTWSSTFGNSASYASEDGTTAAKSSTPFGGSLATSANEVFIMTDKVCNGDDCGFYRPNSVAHHGFNGSSKAFLFEFQMPDNPSGDSSGLPNAPAIWMLNANIPRVSQYGTDSATKTSCSCWDSGCGEFDIFEVLSAGDKRCKSTLHRQHNAQGGDSNYFKRPTDAPVKVAVVMTGGNFIIATLKDDVTFDETFESSTMQSMLNAYDNPNHQSVFAIVR
ncbi:hypothetical protein EJ05DRAFT_156191 [Pseudovirgaria hyperparasitica]|uniref:glucan endo-1,3-beta-D-glucosidase n=1 Tax=Pseudovirgaria hyperparasitica TaxID=470096 RepID=A0A6A6VWU8_9PEZI|nr:uncharacterized protein EJ05DRAFT_156191 [Pseudovirgaria hyperparasitica]KAF2754329.1 hypothetical protein EJ05DRAFT_156191 [Pseudovirgaria hyperparasitica]